MTGSTINGTPFLQTGPVDPTSSTSAGALLFGSTNVTIDQNTFTGGSDIGISVTAGSANSIISFNAIDRPNPPDPDSYGLGVSVDPDLVEQTRLICNTFSGWQTDIDPADEVQEACPPPTTTTTTTTPTTTTPGAETAAGVVTREEGLARTGGSPTMLVIVGLLALMAGAGLTLIGRYATRRG
jgi:parallel beta-helix repeat protein